MSFFKNLRVRYKMAIVILVAAIGMIIIGRTGYKSLINAQADMDAIYSQNVQSLQNINEAINDVRVIQSRALQVIIENDPTKLQSRLSDMNKIMNDYEAMWQAYQNEASPAAREEMANTEKYWQSYKATMQSIAQLGVEGKNEEAAARYENQGSTDTIKLRDSLTKLVSTESASVKEVNEKNHTETKKAMFSILITTIIIFLILLAFATLFIKEITSSLKAMIAICNKLSNGDYRRPKEKSITATDEFGQMAMALDKAVAGIAGAMNKMNSSTQQVAASSEELTASSSQASQMSMQVAQSATTTANVVERHKLSVQKGKAAIDQIGVSIDDIKNESVKAAEHATDVADHVSKGTSSVKESTEKIHTVAQTVEASARTVEKLGKSSQQIGQIIDTIDSIAKQTNLLALNAAIEAARAGEQGKGFAVVAEEIRKLAEQSQDATAKITELINSTLADTKGAVEAMQNGRTQVVEGATLVGQLGSMFSEIDAEVAQVSSQLQSMSSFVDKVADNAKDLENEVSTIEKDGNEISTEMQSVSASTEEQSASAEEIASASSALSDLAQNLQMELHKFKF